LTKTPLIYSVAYLNLGGLEFYLGRAKHTETPCGDGNVTDTKCANVIRQGPGLYPKV